MKKLAPVWQIRAIEFFAKNKFLMSLCVITLGFLLSNILLLLVGKSPSVMYQAIFQTISGYDLTRMRFNSRYIGMWISISMPLILTGLSLNFALRSGFFNIGAEGQFIMGLTFAQYFAFVLPRIPTVTSILAVCLGGFAGAIWGGIVGWLRGKYKVSEVVVTIMFNYIAFFFSRWFSQQFLPGANSYRADDFPHESMLTNEWFQKITNGSLLNNGIFLVIIALIFYHIFMEQTKYGFTLKASGFNSTAAKFSGINPVSSAIVAMGIAGFFAGLAGAIVYLGSFTFGRIIQVQDQYGFNGIAVGLVSGGSALGTLLSGLFFGLLNSSGPLMQARGIPREITNMISAFVVIFIAIEHGVSKKIKQWIISKNTKN